MHVNDTELPIQLSLELGIHTNFTGGRKIMSNSRIFKILLLRQMDNDSKKFLAQSVGFMPLALILVKQTNPMVTTHDSECHCMCRRMFQSVSRSVKTEGFVCIPYS